ncbi:MAG TPA: TetR family transcriptional regulator [Solirubrobacteraceae bacterium]|jgi:AcrR family transcriptional regulator
MAATITRERILDEAMHLFSEQGFKATTIVQIEAASGLTPGAGGIYHHFANKEALLAAGIERHLQRLDALRDIREIFAGVGDLRTELTIAARYILAELDREAELMRILATEAHNRPGLVAAATERLLGSTLRGFAGWLAEHSERELSGEDAEALASLSLGGLVSTRLLKGALAMSTTVDDERLVGSWVGLLEPALRS